MSIELFWSNSIPDEYFISPSLTILFTKIWNLVFKVKQEKSYLTYNQAIIDMKYCLKTIYNNILINIVSTKVFKMFF